MNRTGLHAPGRPSNIVHTQSDDRLVADHTQITHDAAAAAMQPRTAGVRVDSVSLDAHTEYVLPKGTEMVVFAGVGVKFKDGTHRWPMFELADGRMIDLSKPAAARAFLGHDFACVSHLTSF